MREMKNKKLKAILSITGYFLLVIAICVSASIVFHNTYYESVYVSGSSMSPTLNGSVINNSYGFDVEEEGSTVDFGIIDTHQSAKNNVKRFSIISTYFYDDFDASGALVGEKKQKVKRVIALPGETFKIEEGKLYVKKGEEFEYIPYTFQTEPANSKAKDISEQTLADDEYWALGDHRDRSRDCGSLYRDNGDFHKSSIKKSYLVGVLVAIEGRATLKLKECICENCHKNKGGTIYCSNCLAKVTRVFELVDKQYHWPKYF